MNVSAARPAPASPPIQQPHPARRKDADGDYDGPPKAAGAPAAATASTASAPIVVNGKFDTHA